MLDSAQFSIKKSLLKSLLKSLFIERHIFLTIDKYFEKKYLIEINFHCLQETKIRVSLSFELLIFFFKLKYEDFLNVL